MAARCITEGAMPADAENSSDRAANLDKLIPTGETTGRYHAGRPFFILAISAARRPPKEKLSMGDVPIYFSTYRLRQANSQHIWGDKQNKC
jgi:hypothetical protein